MALNGVYSANGNGASTRPEGGAGGATALTKAKTLISSGHNLNGLIYLMYARHNFVFCTALVDRCIASGCDLEYPYYVKGLIKRHEGKPAEAIKNFQKAVEYNSTNTESYREIAKTLYQMGRFKQSLEIFIRTDSILKRADCETHYYIAKLLLTKNVAHGQLKRQDAKEYYLKAVQMKHLPSMHELAEIYVRQGDLIKAIELLESSLQINCDDVNVLTRMGVLHLMAGETQTALTRLLDALVIDASSPKLLLALGGILQARGDADGALNKYKSIENLADQGAEIWSNLGLCLRNQKLIAAISCLRKSIWIAPLNFNALFNLGYVFLKAKLYASAFHTFATAISLKPNHVECFMLLGVCLSALKDQKNANAALEKATTLPDAAKYPLSFLNFAIICYQSEAYQRSRSNLNRYLELVDIKTEADQQSHGLRNQHLKLANKLMALLKIVEPDHPHEHGNEHISGLTENSGADISVAGQLVTRSGDDDGISPSVYEENEPSGPSLVAVPAANEGKADLEDDDDDSLEGGTAGDYEGEGDAYEYVTVVADVERENN